MMSAQLKASLWLVVEQLTLMFSSFIFISIASRAVSVESFGQLSTVQYYFSSVGVFVTLALNGIFFQKLCLYKNERSKEYLIGTIVFIQTLMSIITGSLLILLVVFSQDDQVVFLMIIFSVATTFRRADTLSIIWKEKERTSVIFKARGISRLLSLIYVLCLYQIDCVNIIYYAFYYIIESLVFLVLLLIAYHSNLKMKLKLKPTLCFPIFNKVKSEIPNNLAISFALALPIILLQKYHDATIVAPLALSLTLLSIVMNLSNSFCDGFYKKIATEKEQCRQVEYIQKYLRTATLVSVLLVGLFFLFDIHIISLLFGEKYVQYVTVFNWVSLLLLVVVPSRMFYRVIYMHSLQSFNKYRVMPAAFLSIACSFLFIRDYGVFGAVASLFVYYFVGDFFGYLFNSRISFVIKIYFSSFFLKLGK